MPDAIDAVPAARRPAPADPGDAHEAPANPPLGASSATPRSGPAVSSVPPVTTGLEGAFSPRIPWRGVSALDDAQLSWSRTDEEREALEADALADAGAFATLVPYREFDSTRPLVVLVHGLTGGPARFSRWAPVLHREGFQVVFVAYTDADRLTHESGQDIAKALQIFRNAYYPAGTPVTIVGHSMGGTVARAALNYLQDPSWLGPWRDDATADFQPRAGFGEVRLRTMDTSWDGAPSLGTDVPPLRWVARVGMEIRGLRGGFELFSNSQISKRINSVPLDGVSYHNIPATAPLDDSRRIYIRVLSDFSEAELKNVALGVRDGRPRGAHRARNTILALLADDRAGALREALRERLAGVTDREAIARIFLEVHAEVMTPFEGNHGSLLHSSSGGFRQVLAELRESRSADPET